MCLSDTPVHDSNKHQQIQLTPGIPSNPECPQSTPADSDCLPDTPAETDFFQASPTDSDFIQITPGDSDFPHAEIAPTVVLDLQTQRELLITLIKDLQKLPAGSSSELPLETNAPVKAIVLPDGQTEKISGCSIDFLCKQRILL